jgi:tetratricopeptide (TPR) repeat protein
MDIRTPRKIALLLATAVSFSACQQLVLRPEPQPEAKPVVQQPPQEHPPEPPAPLPPPDKIPASQRVTKALQRLDQGDYENARNQLVWALQEKPGLQIADKLIQQIDADPIDYLGMKNFSYRVERGESLSIIAGKFLEDPMKFVILARYNKLENPSQLAPGDRIRVPGVMPDQVWRKPKKKPHRPKPPPDNTQSGSEDGESDSVDNSETTSGPIIDSQLPTLQPAAPTSPSLEQVLDSARKLHAAGDLPAAIYQLESGGGRFTGSQTLKSLEIDYDREYSDLLIKQGKLEQARDVLEKLVLLDGSKEQTVNDLIRVEDKLEARKLYTRGSDLLASGSVEEAYKILTQALIYDPDNTLAKQAQTESRDKLIDIYHRQAMQHFRKQELDPAIALWDKILALDPEHTLASGYKARALEMKQKLEKIESDSQ